MSYDRDEYAATPHTFGRKGILVDISSEDSPIGAEVKAVVVVAAGNVVYCPAGNDQSGSEDIIVTDAGVGFCLPHLPSFIRKTGTTATLCTVAD